MTAPRPRPDNRRATLDRILTLFADHGVRGEVAAMHLPRWNDARCSNCLGEAGYHTHNCPRHDERVCALCRKIATLTPARPARSA